MKRIIIIGTSCTGKTTLAKQLGIHLNIRVTDLDDIHWMPNWIHISDDRFKKEVSSLVNNDSWIISGNYSVVQDILLEACDTVIWLNYSKSVVWSRAIKRTFKRVFLKEPCCNGNYETFKLAFMSKDSILWWIYNDYPRKKKKYTALFNDGSLEGKIKMEFKHPSETKQLFTMD